MMEPNEIVRALRGYSQDLVAYKLGAEYADVVSEAADCIERLQAELEASQRQLRAAVEDIKKPSVCDCCKRYCQGDDMCIDNGRMNFEWRGPSEAGEESK